MKKNGNDNLEEEKKQLEKRLKEIKEEEKKKKKKIRGRVLRKTKLSSNTKSNDEAKTIEYIEPSVENNDFSSYTNANYNTSRSKIKDDNSNMNMSALIIIVIIVSVISGLIGALIVTKLNGGTTTTGGVTTSSVKLTETNSIADSVEKVYDAVVVVEGYSKKQLSSTGTGFVYKKANGKAYIMTNSHVVSDCETVKVLFTNGDELETTIVGNDTYSDIAVLSVKDSDKIKSATMGGSKKSKVGDTIFAVGSPEGADYAGTVTKGILSGKDRLVAVALSNSTSSDYYMNVLQTDTAINPGNSGGPLCNINGEVIGITNMKLVEDSVEGMGFAIPIEDALTYANTLEKNGKIERPYVGISMLDITNDYYLWQAGITLPENVTAGVAVYSVEKDSPAEKAGLKKGDIITKIEDKKTDNLAEFRYQLYKHSPNDKIKITYIRDGKEESTTITLGENKN